MAKYGDRCKTFAGISAAWRLRSVAECDVWGTLEDSGGEIHQMANIIPGHSKMVVSDLPGALLQRRRLCGPALLAAHGEIVRGHEFSLLRFYPRTPRV